MAKYKVMAPGTAPTLGDIDPPWRARCHHVPRVIFRHRTLAIYAASGYAVDDAVVPGRVMRFDLRGNAGERSNTLSVPPGWHEWARRYNVETCHVAWPDGGIPPLVYEFWPAVLSELLARQYDACVWYCVGGHGRTGTALACLALSAGIVTDATAAIEYVRAKHCSRAIETIAQEQYIARVASQFPGTPNPRPQGRRKE